MGEEIYICGHRNPDTDSICAAAVYAYLKNRNAEDESTYIPIRCGNINPQTKFIFSQVEITLPRLLHDIHPRVKSVARRDYPVLTPDDSIYTAISTLDRHNLSVLPVVSRDKQFRGLLSIHEVSTFLIQDNLEQRPVYTFNIDNFLEVVPGSFLLKGEETAFSASIMIGAMPYEVSIERVSVIPGGRPLLVTGMRNDLIEYAVKHSFPAIVLTGCEHEKIEPALFSGYKGSVFISHIDTAETVRRLRMSVPVEKIMNADPELIDSETLYTKAKDALVHSSYRGLPVMEEGSYYGIVSRRCFIDRPRNRLILVDHNELDQSISGAPESEIEEIVDHHRLGSIRTRLPIYMNIRPVGSTCTIIYDMCRTYLEEVPRDYLLLLLSGILSDTVILRSPTTTSTDREAAETLARHCGISVSAWGEEIFSNTTSLQSDNYRELILTDFKTYTEFGMAVGIGQIEVITFQDLPEAEGPLHGELEALREEMKLDWAMILVTNIIREESILLTTKLQPCESLLNYPEINSHRYALKGVLSRKKQLLPEILRVLEESQEEGKV